MKFYLAPLEGITGYIYRNVYHEMFCPMDKYFTPFLVPNQNWRLKTKELKDILPEHNRGLFTVPQILTKSVKDFIWIAEVLQDFGYKEINLNLGCPSKTVVTKDKGSGFLAHTEELDTFLAAVFARAQIGISIKTRLGIENPDEFYKLLDIYNKYPIKELIIHPRIQKDFYKNKPNLEIFNYAIKNSKNPLCYNGNIFSREDYLSLCKSFPTVKAVMLGRGIIKNPALLDEIQNKDSLHLLKLKEFHDKICEEYQRVLCGDHNVLFKMKELWDYMGISVIAKEKNIKKIKKAKSFQEYRQLVDELWISNN